MKVLTVKQPWASLIIFSGKDIENRDWHAPQSLIGKRIAIHSSKKFDPLEYRYASQLAQSRGLVVRLPANDAYGCIIGTVTLVACVTQSSSPWFQGDFGFVLKDPKPLQAPIRTPGHLKFWDWNEEL